MHSNNNTFKLASQQPTEIHKLDLSSEQQGCTLDLPRMGETKSAQLKELVGRRCVSRGVGGFPASLLPSPTPWNVVACDANEEWWAKREKQHDRKDWYKAGWEVLVGGGQAS